MSLREAIEVSDGTLAVSSLSTQEQAQVSGAVGIHEHDRLQHPHDGPGIQRATGVWTIALNRRSAGDQHERGDHQRLQPAGGEREHAGAGRQREAQIAINGAGLGSVNGLTIGQPGSQVSGLDIENFGDAGVADHGRGQRAGRRLLHRHRPDRRDRRAERHGVVIENSSNLIGGPNVGDRNVISGNDSRSYGTVHPRPGEQSAEHRADGQPDREQLSSASTPPGPRRSATALGVDDSGSGNTYGGTTAGLGNVISGNKARRAQGRLGASRSRGTTSARTRPAMSPWAMGGGYGNHSEQDAGGAPVLSTTITNNVVSGNQVGRDLRGGELAGEPGDLHDREQPDRDQRRRDRGAGEQLESGLALASVENATVLDNVISANGGSGLAASGIRGSACNITCSRGT